MTEPGFILRGHDGDVEINAEQVRAIRTGHPAYFLRDNKVIADHNGEIVEIPADS